MRVIATAVLAALCGAFFLLRESSEVRRVPVATVWWVLERNGIQRTRPTLIVYVTTTCPYCEELLRRIARSPVLRDSIESNSLSVLIFSNKQRDSVLPGLIPLRPALRFQIDTNGSYAERLGVSKVPMIISFRGNGVVAPATLGLLSQAMIDSLLRASQP